MLSQIALPGRLVVRDDCLTPDPEMVVLALRSAPALWRRVVDSVSCCGHNSGYITAARRTSIFVERFHRLIPSALRTSEPASIFPGSKKTIAVFGQVFGGRVAVR